MGFGQLISILFLIWPVLGFAGNPDVGAPVVAKPASPLPWSDESRYQACDQVCLLQRANENISLQALSIIRRVEMEKSIFREGVSNSDPSQFQAVLEDLKGYCGDFYTSGGSKENARDCLKRFIQIQSSLLKKMQTAILLNSSKEYHYYSKDAASIATGIQDPKKPQTPYAPSKQELDALSAGSEARFTELGRLKYSDWANDQASDRLTPVLPQKPSEMDFCKFVSVPDPVDSKGPPISTIKTRADGSCEYDQKAYDSALRDYGKLKTEIQNQVKAIQDPGWKFLPSPSPSPSLNGAERSYLEARKIFNKTSNELLRKQGVAVMDFPAPPLKKGAKFSEGSAQLDPNATAGDVPPLETKPTTQKSAYNLILTPEQIGKFLEQNLDQQLDLR